LTRREVAIAGRRIGPSYQPYIVAELSGNHNGDLRRALRLIDMAKDAGADAVKLQTYTADTITIDHDGSDFRIEGGPWNGRSLYDLYQEAHTPWEWHAVLFAHAAKTGIAIFSTPFDTSAVDFLEKLGTPAYKIASFEAIDLPLIAKAAATGKPLIISTGMCSREEIAEAVEAARAVGCAELVLLHCVSAYPAPAADANLRTLTDLAERFDVVVGLSDHTMHSAVSIAAVAQGACLIEKHVTLARADGGPDSAFSLEPGELKALVEGCGVAWEALGTRHYGPASSERGSVQFRRSLYAVRNIAAGETLTEHNVRSIRPGFGLPPKAYGQVVGARARSAIPRGTPLAWSMIDGIAQAAATETSDK
jgi:pseudaminic acid synthase